MKTYLSEIIPKIRQYSKRLDDLSLLTNQNWISISDIKDQKSTYIFLKDNRLLITENGSVNKAKWEYINKDSILIEKDNVSFLFKHGFLDSNILALKIDGQNGYAIFINESNSLYELNNLDSVHNFLKSKYIDKQLETPKKFYCVNPSNWKEFGPYTAREVFSKVRRGKLKRNFYIREENIKDYKSLLKIGDLI